MCDASDGKGISAFGSFDWVTDPEENDPHLDLTGHWRRTTQSSLKKPIAKSAILPRHSGAMVEQKERPCSIRDRLWDGKSCTCDEGCLLDVRQRRVDEESNGRWLRLGCQVCEIWLRWGRSPTKAGRLLTSPAPLNPTNLSNN